MKKLFLASSAMILLGVFISHSGCKKDDDNNPPSTVTDLDGNAYHTVTIGTQVWMVENLKTTKFSDGTAIPLVSDNVAWISLNSPGYCYYGNDYSNSNTYGALYNWYAVNTGILAPAGWHVPTDADWTTLEDYVNANLGNSGSVAKALASKTDWTSSTEYGAIGNDLTKNNASGFSALPGGGRGDYGYFSDIGGTGIWWSSSETNGGGAWYRDLWFNWSEVGHGSSMMLEFGFSVRCIKDQ